MRGVEAALWYAERGHKVHPVKTDESKAPYTMWQDTATSDPERVAALWRAHPDANIGVVVPDGVVCIDIDPQHGGHVDNLTAEVGDLPDTFTVRSGSHEDSLHLFYRLPDDLPLDQIKGRLLGAQIDTRKGGRHYTLGAGSVHPATGQPYVVARDLPMVEAPSALVEFIRKPTAYKPAWKGKRSTPAPAVEGSPFVRTADKAAGSRLDSLIDEVRSSQVGRNNTLASVAYSVGWMVAAGQVDEDEAIERLTEAADHAIPDEREKSHRTLSRQLREGMAAYEPLTVDGLQKSATAVPVDGQVPVAVDLADEVYLEVILPLSLSDHLNSRSALGGLSRALEPWRELVAGVQTMSGHLHLLALADHIITLAEAQPDGTVTARLVVSQVPDLSVDQAGKTLTAMIRANLVAKALKRSGRGGVRLQITEPSSTILPEPAKPEFTLNAGQEEMVQRIDAILDAPPFDYHVTDTFSRSSIEPTASKLNIGGSGGTGKTVVGVAKVASSAEERGMSTLFVSPTWQAADVMRASGFPARSIHSAFGLYGDGQNRQVAERALANYDVVVVDESSMVGARLTAAILPYAKRVIAFGDPHQLDPVNDRPCWTDPDIMLTESMRFAGDSDIARVGGMLRKVTDDDWHPGLLDVVKVDDVRAADYDAILTYSNFDRFQLVEKIRGGLHEPVVGDVIQTRTNDIFGGVWNRRGFTVAEVEGLNLPFEHEKYGSLPYHKLIVRPDRSDRHMRLAVFAAGFRSSVEEQWIAREVGFHTLPGGDLFEYVYAATWRQAMTIHSAQGSEWPRVLLVARPHFLADPPKGALYTAVTRARTKFGLYVP